MHYFFLKLCLQTNKDDNHIIQFCYKIANISVQNMTTICTESHLKCTNVVVVFSLQNDVTSWRTMVLVKSLTVILIT